MNCVIAAWGRHEAELRGYLKRQLGGDLSGAEDLLQDTFLRAIKQGAEFCELSNPRAWLFQVARSRLSDHFRRAGVRQSSALDEKTLPEEIETIAAVERLDVCLPTALAALSAQDRHVIEHCDLNGMSQTRYASSEGLALPTVKSRIQRARKRLKAELDRRCGVHYDEAGQVCCHQAMASDPG